MQVDVDDTAFRDYKKSFDQYAALVKGLPADFAKQWQVLGNTKTRFNEIVAAMVAQTFQARQTAAAQKEADRLTRTWADNWRSVAKSGKDFAGSIAGVARDVIRMVGPLSLLGGLLGAGGLFGLDKLAGAVAGQRRSAMGLGVGYGQQSAFGLNFGRFVDANSMLGNVSGALYNATSPGYPALLAAGINPQFLSSHNAAEVSAELLRRLPGMFGKTPKNLIGAQAEALGLNQIISSEDIVRYVSASPDERRKQEESYQKDVGRLDVDPQTQRGWQDFLTQLDRAGRQLETSLIKGLVALVEPIGRLSDAIANLVTSALGNDELKKWIDNLAGGIENFAKFIGTDAFKQDVSDFISAIGSMAKAVKSALQYFGFLPKEDALTTTNDNIAGPSGSRGIYNRALHAGRLNGGASSAFVINNNGSMTPLRIPGRGTPSSLPTGADVGDTANRLAYSVGVRNFNPTNIGYGGWAAAHGATGGSGWDTGHQVAVFPSYAAGIQAAETLALSKYNHGLTTANSLISTPGLGWTPGNPVAGQNIARYMGVAPDADLQLNDPEHMRRFIRALIQQEVGPQGAAYVGSHYHELGTRPTVTIHNNTGANTIVTTNQAINN